MTQPTNFLEAFEHLKQEIERIAQLQDETLQEQQLKTAFEEFELWVEEGNMEQSSTILEFANFLHANRPTLLNGRIFISKTLIHLFPLLQQSTTISKLRTTLIVCIADEQYGIGKAEKKKNKIISWLQQAIKSYQKVIEINNEDATAWHNLGNAQSHLALLQTDPDAKKKGLLEAIGSYKKAIQIDPNDAGAWNNLGVAQHDLALLQADTDEKKKGLIDAIGSYQKAIEIDRNFAGAWNNLGVAQRDLALLQADPDKKMKGLQEAIKSYQKAIDINPDYAGAWNNRGNAQHNLAECSDEPEKSDLLQNAINSYRTAIALDNYYLSPIFNLFLLYKTHYPLQAANAFKRWLYIANYQIPKNNLSTPLNYLKDSGSAFSPWMQYEFSQAVPVKEFLSYESIFTDAWQSTLVWRSCLRLLQTTETQNHPDYLRLRALALCFMDADPLAYEIFDSRLDVIKGAMGMREQYYYCLSALGFEEPEAKAVLNFACKVALTFTQNAENLNASDGCYYAGKILALAAAEIAESKEQEEELLSLARSAYQKAVDFWPAQSALWMLQAEDSSNPFPEKALAALKTAYTKWGWNKQTPIMQWQLSAELPFEQVKKGEELQAIQNHLLPFIYEYACLHECFVHWWRLQNDEDSTEGICTPLWEATKASAKSIYHHEDGQNKLLKLSDAQFLEICDYLEAKRELAQTPGTELHEKILKLNPEKNTTVKDKLAGIREDLDKEEHALEVKTPEQKLIEAFEERQQHYTKANTFDGSFLQVLMWIYFAGSKTSEFLPVKPEHAIQLSTPTFVELLVWFKFHLQKQGKSYQDIKAMMEDFACGVLIEQITVDFILEILGMRLVITGFRLAGRLTKDTKLLQAMRSKEEEHYRFAAFRERFHQALCESWGEIADGMKEGEKEKYL